MKFSVTPLTDRSYSSPHLAHTALLPSLNCTWSGKGADSANLTWAVEGKEEGAPAPAASGLLLHLDWAGRNLSQGQGVVVTCTGEARWVIVRWQGCLRLLKLASLRLSVLNSSNGQYEGQGQHTGSMLGSGSKKSWTWSRQRWHNLSRNYLYIFSLFSLYYNGYQNFLFTMTHCYSRYNGAGSFTRAYWYKCRLW